MKSPARLFSSIYIYDSKLKVIFEFSSGPETKPKFIIKKIHVKISYGPYLYFRFECVAVYENEDGSSFECKSNFPQNGPIIVN